MARAAVVIGRWFVRAALVLLLAAVAFAIAVLVVLPRAVNGTALTVLTGSMSPKIPVGSVVVDRPVDPGTLHVGDIATYQKAPGVNVYITHRIIKIDASKSPTMFTFKGDANRGPDINAVPATAIRGKVWFHVPYLGSIRDAIHTKRGVGGIAALVLALYALFQFGSWFGDRRRGSPGSKSTSAVASATLVDSWTVVDQVIDKNGRVSRPLSIHGTLSRSQFKGLDPETVCHLLKADLIEVDDASFTVRITDGAVSRLRKPVSAGRHA